MYRSKHIFLSSSSTCHPIYVSSLPSPTSVLSLLPPSPSTFSLFSLSHLFPFSRFLLKPSLLTSPVLFFVFPSLVSFTQLLTHLLRLLPFTSPLRPRVQEGKSSEEEQGNLRACLAVGVKVITSNNLSLVGVWGASELTTPLATEVRSFVTISSK